MVEIPGSGVWRAQRSWLLPPGLVTTAARGEATLAPGARWDDVLLRTMATSPPGWAVLPASFAPGAACGGQRLAYACAVELCCSLLAVRWQSSLWPGVPGFACESYL